MNEKDDKTLPISYSDAEKAKELSFSSRFKNLKYLGEGVQGGFIKHTTAP